jgi:hypothetical protein
MIIVASTYLRFYIEIGVGVSTFLLIPPKISSDSDSTALVESVVKIRPQQYHVKEQYTGKGKIFELQVQYWTKIQNVFFLDKAWFTIVGT